MLDKIDKFIDSMGIDFSDTNFFIIYKLVINEFYSDKNSSIQIINFVFYDKFKIQPHLFDSTKKLCNERLGQTNFRNDLISFYQTCIISGDDSDICQACHILPYSKTKINCVDNGLLLNYNFHHLFDSFLISFKYKSNYDDIYDLYHVVLSDSVIAKPSYSNFTQYNGKIVKINSKSKTFLESSYKLFLNSSST